MKKKNGDIIALSNSNVVCQFKLWDCSQSLSALMWDKEEEPVDLWDTEQIILSCNFNGIFSFPYFLTFSCGIAASTSSSATYVRYTIY